MPYDVSTRYPGIIIRMKNQSDSVLFPTLVKEALDKIASRPLGAKLLQRISGRAGQARFGYTICIQRADMTYNSGCETKWVGTNKAVRGNEISATTLGVGSITAITYNANMISTPDGNRPSWVGLAHELIHAYYNLKGKGQGIGEVMNVNGMVNIEEMATVGLGAGPHRSITENGIRAEHNLPARTTYGGK